MHTWTPEVAMSAQILDAVRNLSYTLVMVNHDGKGAKPKPPEPAPRPYSPLEKAMARANHAKRKQEHDSLVARMLPHKAAK
jgi:hypothetical protein